MTSCPGALLQFWCAMTSATSLGGTSRRDWKVHLERLCQLLQTLYLLQTGELELLETLGEVRSKYIRLPQFCPARCYPSVAPSLRNLF